ncbi:MAG: hypothetical protein HS104_41095 [Polyangiaceae bacterium]|nr:hypothetical protein [Polyangiaceae bacterium]
MFHRCLGALMRTYGRSDLFRLVTYDAGACSRENARAVRDLGLHYLFAGKSTQPSLHTEAVRWLYRPVPGHHCPAGGGDPARLGENRSRLSAAPETVPSGAACGIIAGQVRRF